jgi:hypothetical protein
MTPGAKKKGGFLRIAALMAIFATLAPMSGCPVKVAHPRVSPENLRGNLRGVGLGLFATDPDYDYAHLLDEIVHLGASDLLVVVAWYQADVHAHRIAPRPGFTPSSATIQRTLAQARSRGLRVALLPIVRLEKRTPKQWRGRIDPSAGVQVWFEHYWKYISQMAELAEEEKVERFGVGSELLSLERHQEKWRGLIKKVRQRYQGRLFYSANWDHFAPIGFWDALDEVGVTGYFELTRKTQFQDGEILDAWRRVFSELDDLSRLTNKPVILTEIGYPSRKSAARFPWDETRRAPIDLGLQARLLDLFCQAEEEQTFLFGYYVWNWFGFGGPQDGGYTPRGKPAARVLQACLTKKTGARP